MHDTWLVKFNAVVNATLSAEDPEEYLAEHLRQTFSNPTFVERGSKSGLLRIQMGALENLIVVENLALSDEGERLAGLKKLYDFYARAIEKEEGH
jgi:hypothetical protein